VATSGVIVLGWGATPTEQRDARALAATQNHSESAESAQDFISSAHARDRSVEMPADEAFASSFPRRFRASLRLPGDDFPVNTRRWRRCTPVCKRSSLDGLCIEAELTHYTRPLNTNKHARLFGPLTSALNYVYIIAYNCSLPPPFQSTSCQLPG
jgi:hypothetical protein